MTNSGDSIGEKIEKKIRMGFIEEAMALFDTHQDRSEYDSSATLLDILDTLIGYSLAKNDKETFLRYIKVGISHGEFYFDKDLSIINVFQGQGADFKKMEIPMNIPNEWLEDVVAVHFDNFSTILENTIADHHICNFAKFLRGEGFTNKNYLNYEAYCKLIENSEELIQRKAGGLYHEFAYNAIKIFIQQGKLQKAEEYIDHFIRNDDLKEKGNCKRSCTEINWCYGSKKF